MAGTETLPIEFGRKTLTTLARAAQAGGRFGEMVEFMQRLVTAAHGRLSPDERDLFVSALGSHFATGENTWKALLADGAPPDPEVVEYTRTLRAELETLARNWREQVRELVRLEPSPEYHVMYTKLAGDRFATLAALVPDQRDAYARTAAEIYEGALQVAVEKLIPAHPLRVGLVLNYVTCKYELLKDHKDAITLAKRTFDDAISKLDQLDEASYKDTTLLMQQLRDALTRWLPAGE